jgi:hypothetical protein
MVNAVKPRYCRNKDSLSFFVLPFILLFTILACVAEGLVTKIYAFSLRAVNVLIDLWGLFTSQIGTSWIWFIAAKYMVETKNANMLIYYKLK